ncbi:MAG: hypothetical protein FJZ85_04135, partial [Chloroflexi bacterium]|nr:hypothetical protein [Chloroflexota bacterium]
MRVQNIVLCPRCQAQNPPGQRICWRCGTRWCTRCHAILPDKSRFCPTCGFLCGSNTWARAAQQYTAVQQPQMPPVPPRPYTPQPQYQPPSRPQPATPQLTPSRTSATHRNCPRCSASLSAANTQCFSCGLLIGRSMPHEGPPQTPQMPHQMTPQASPYRPMTPPTPTSAQPQVPRPQAVLGTIQQSYSGGYITGARAQQGYAVQSVPVPIPHAVNKPDSYSQSPATPRVSAQQPLAPAMGTAIAAPAAVNYPVPSRAFQGDSRSLAARGYAIPAPRTGGMLRTLLALLISVTLFITGYYIITQVWKPAISLPQNISTPRLSFGEKPATIKNVQLSSITP